MMSRHGSAFRIPCVRRMHPSGVWDSPHKGPGFDVVFCSLTNMLVKQSSCRWFESPWPPCDVIVMFCYCVMQWGLNKMPAILADDIIWLIYLNGNHLCLQLYLYQCRISSLTHTRVIRPQRALLDLDRQHQISLSWYCTNIFHCR